jgi:hypothetical protein
VFRLFISRDLQKRELEADVVTTIDYRIFCNVKTNISIAGETSICVDKTKVMHEVTRYLRSFIPGPLFIGSLPTGFPIGTNAKQIYSYWSSVLDSPSKVRVTVEPASN